MRTRSIAALVIGLIAAAIWFSAMTSSATIAEAASARQAPAFTHTQTKDWINSKPLDWDQLRGKVVLLDVWTFDCWNCYRSFPWLRTMESDLSQESFEVIGIHTPEFEHEKIRANIVAKVKEFDLQHPVMIDNDFTYWRALGNRFWPTYYLVDKKGRLRASFIGETHKGSSQAQKIESTIRALLTES